MLKYDFFNQIYFIVILYYGVTMKSKKKYVFSILFFILLFVATFYLLFSNNDINSVITTLKTIPIAIILVKYGMKKIVSKKSLNFILSNKITAINIDIISASGTTTTAYIDVLNSAV